MKLSLPIPPHYFAPTHEQEGSDFWHAATSLSLLTESLYQVWLLEPERRRDAESMRQEGLESSARSAAAGQDNTIRIQVCACLRHC